MESYANIPDEASREELINLLFLKTSEVTQSGLVDLKFDASGQCDGTPHVSWHVGIAKAPDYGDCTDSLHLIDTPSKYRAFDEEKCRDWINELHDILWNAMRDNIGGAK